MENNNGKVHQRWQVVYVDEYKGEPTKGQFNEKFGLYVERDFYVVSSLPDNRYLDLSTTGTWSSRLRMVEEPKFGTSTNNL
jgi:hypothetical protein